MKRILLLPGALVLLPLAFAQNPGAVANEMKTEAINQRMRGKEVSVVEAEKDQPSQRKIDLTEVQKKADELNGLVQSVNGDMKNLQKGMLAADLTQKLKRIEKLAKELRRTLE